MTQSEVLELTRSRMLDAQHFLLDEQRKKEKKRQKKKEYMKNKKEKQEKMQQNVSFDFQIVEK